MPGTGSASSSFDQGFLWTGPGEAWADRHVKWLGKTRFEQPLLEVVFGEYLAHHEVLLARRDRLDALILEQSVQSPWAPMIARLRCLRGIDTLTAVGLVAEIGDITAFAHPKQLASYLGLVPSERSSGTRRTQGSITKAGSSHARRLLVEAAWHYRRRPALLAGTQAPPAWSAACRDRGCLAGTATATPPLVTPRRGTREETHDRRGRGRPRGEHACFVWEISNQPTDRTPPIPFGVGWRPGAVPHGVRDPAMSTNPGWRARS